MKQLMKLSLNVENKIDNSNEPAPKVELLKLEQQHS